MTRREVIGMFGLGLVVAAAWGFGGWRWAALCAGLPIAAFYLYGEMRGL